MPSVVFYISGHGFGHASRQIEIINALGPRLPSRVRIVVRTEAPAWLFERTLRVPVQIVPGRCDTGIVQLDSLRLDEARTVEEAAGFYGAFGERTAEDAQRLRELDALLVIADAPPLACAAARAAGRPSIVLGNFTWDWIYEGYLPLVEERAPHVLPVIREAYASAEAGWRLPMHGGFATISPVHDLPFVARHATRPRDEVRAVLGLPAARPLVLSSFGGYGVDGFDAARLDCLKDWTVILTGRDPIPDLPDGVLLVDESQIYAKGLRYEDLVAAVDVVVTKPGYGIISECVANGTAMLYTSRGRFPEYDVMVQEMPRVLRCEYIDQEALLAGAWQDALDRLRAAPPPPETPRTDGAVVAVQAILNRLEVGSPGHDGRVVTRQDG